MAKVISQYKDNFQANQKDKGKVNVDASWVLQDDGTAQVTIMVGDKAFKPLNVNLDDLARAFRPRITGMVLTEDVRKVLGKAVQAGTGGRSKGKLELT